MSRFAVATRLLSGQPHRPNSGRWLRGDYRLFCSFPGPFPSDAHPIITCTDPESDPREAGTSGGLDHRNEGSVATQKVPPPQAVSQLSAVLDSPEIETLIVELEATRWTGRPGFPIRAMVGMALAKSLYAIPTWSRTARLVAEHPGLQSALGCAPSVYACYRFAAKLREHKNLLDDCLSAVTRSLHAEHPEMGRDVAIDGSDL